MDGYFSRKSQSEGTHDQLFARSIVIEDCKNSIAIVSCDVCFLNREVVRKLESKVQTDGIGNLMVVATHNHSGPAMTDYLVEPNEATISYLNNIDEMIYESLHSAKVKCEEATMSIGTSEAFLSINRRRTDGLIDPRVTTVSFRNKNGECIGCILNYACHPTVLGPSNLEISADYPGVCLSVLEDNLKKDCASVFLNGACGDVNPYTCTGYNCRGTFSDVDNIGKQLAHIAICTEQRQLELSQGLRFRKHTISDIPPYGLSFEITALAIGELLIIGVPGEVFAWTGVELKRSIGVPNLLLAGYTNGYYGYFPTQDAFIRGDYETTSICWVDSSAEEQIRQNSLRLANLLVGNSSLGSRPDEI